MFQASLLVTFASQMLMKQHLRTPNSNARFGSEKTAIIMTLLPIHHPPNGNFPHITQCDVRNRTICGLPEGKPGLKEEAVSACAYAQRDAEDHLVAHDHAKASNNGRPRVTAVGRGDGIRAEIRVAVLLKQRIMML